MPDTTVSVDGQEITISRDKITLDRITLDSANPRIQYHIDTSLSGDVTQAALGYALTVGNEQYTKLLENIETNGGILNPIWVVPDGDRFLVIEGNTRVQVYQDLSEKYSDDRWKAIPAYILPHRVSRDQINFIRLEAHLFGTTPWDAYEKARELYRLHTEEDYSLERLSARTKLSTSELRTYILAFQDMREQYLPSRSDPGEAQKFSYFVEFRKNTELKRLVSAGELNVLDFCAWVGEGKFRRGEDVRRLGEVLKDPESREALEVGDFADALDQLSRRNPGANSPLFQKIADVTDGLREMKYSDINEMRQGREGARVAALEDLLAAVQHCVNIVKQV